MSPTRQRQAIDVAGAVLLAVLVIAVARPSWRAAIVVILLGLAARSYASRREPAVRHASPGGASSDPSRAWEAAVAARGGDRSPAAALASSIVEEVTAEIRCVEAVERRVAEAVSRLGSATLPQFSNMARVRRAVALYEVNPTVARLRDVARVLDDAAPSDAAAVARSADLLERRSRDSARSLEPLLIAYHRRICLPTPVELRRRRLAIATLAEITDLLEGRCV
jgi:hypothetical protein